MHIDKTAAHVVSAILHVDHSDDAEPWPLVIEDFDGVTQEVVLDKGEMLFYESAKCLHGRMTSLKGRYYGSIFLHYQPVDTGIWDWTVDRLINLVPPHWKDGVDFEEGRGSRWCGAAGQWRQDLA